MPEKSPTPLLHQKYFETVQTTMPVVVAANQHFAADPQGLADDMLFQTSATIHHIFNFKKCDFQPLPSAALTGTFGAGAASCYHPWSQEYTANGGSTTTVTVALDIHNISEVVVGKTIEFRTGTGQNIGLRRTILSIENLAVAASIIKITLSAALPASVVSSDTFRIQSGSFFCLSAGTLAAGSFKCFDIASFSWGGNLSIVGLPASLGTSGEMTTTAAVNTFFDSGIADTLTGTQLTKIGKNWDIGQWIGYQLRITDGEGSNQLPRVITSNSNDTIIVPSGIIGGASAFVVEGDENAIYYIGNGAPTMYKYTIDSRPGETGNTWSVVSVVGGARAASPGIACSLDWCGVTGNAEWGNVNKIKDGRYLYSLRGGANAAIDRYSIPEKKWEQVAHRGQVTFTSGANSFLSGRSLFLKKEGSATVLSRFYIYDIVGNFFSPLATDMMAGGAAVACNLMAVKQLSNEGEIKWLYHVHQSTATLRRVMIF